MSRGPRLLAAIVGGALFGLGAAMTAFGIFQGLFWLWLFGDDPWPEWPEQIVNAAMFVGGVAGGALASVTIWRSLRRR